MPLIDSAILAYCEAHSSPEPPLLHALRRETHLQVLYPQMLTDPLQGRLLATLSRLMRPQHILEVGAFTGYSCLCLAEGMAPGGHLTTIEVDPERESRIRRYLHLAGRQEQVTLHIGDAKAVIADLSGPFDLIFLDADKANYPVYYELLFSKWAIGGWLIADNVLWQGQVLEPPKNKETRGLSRFNEQLQQDPRIEVMVLPLRDGLTLARKVSGAEMRSDLTPE